jgi:hypothetical protein
MSTWNLNGTPLATLGLELARLSFQAQGPSRAVFVRGCDFDAAESLAYGDAVTLTYGDTTVFSGTVESLPKAASGAAEQQVIEVTDAWEDLERTIYMEVWKTGGDPATAMVPRAILGLAKDELGPGNAPPLAR